MDQMYAGASAPSVQTSSDSGLSGLGLIMQLVGGIMSAIVGSYGMLALIAILQAGGRGGAPGTVIVWLLAVLGTSLARSITHASAGRRLCYEGAGTPVSALNRYITISAVQTAVVCGGMLINDAPGKLMLALLLMLAAWPAALLFLARPKVAAYGDQVPMADDKGFEGASILLLIFGAIGLGIGSIMLLGWLGWPGELKSNLMGIGMLVASVMLTIRSVLHVRAGARGIKAMHMAETAEAAGKYASFGVLASVVSGGVFFIGMIGAMGSRAPGGAMIMMLLMVVMITWVLLIWPLAVRRFFGDRQFATMINENAPSLQQSSDRGLPTLGWLLVAFGVWALASGFAGILFGDMVDDEGGMRGMGRGGNPFGEMMALFGNTGGKSPWIGIVTAALQLWAGVELIRLTPRYKLAGMVFGIAAVGTALYVYLPILGNLVDGGAAMLSNPLVSIMFAAVAMALVVPVATLVFVQRKVRDPKAIAQTFE